MIHIRDKQYFNGNRFRVGLFSLCTFTVVLGAVGDRSVRTAMAAAQRVPGSSDVVLTGDTLIPIGIAIATLFMMASCLGVIVGLAWKFWKDRAAAHNELVKLQEHLEELHKDTMRLREGAVLAFKALSHERLRRQEQRVLMELMCEHMDIDINLIRDKVRTRSPEDTLFDADINEALRKLMEK